MTVIGSIGAGEVGSQVARAAIANGYDIVIANSRGPETLKDLIDELGPSARAATAVGAAAAGEFAVVAVLLKVVNDMPMEEPAGTIVLDTNNYMVWRDGHFPIIDPRSSGPSPTSRLPASPPRERRRAPPAA
jgi:predicted dinucleotide-binding enzyme